MTQWVIFESGCSQLVQKNMNFKLIALFFAVGVWAQQSMELAEELDPNLPELGGSTNFLLGDLYVNLSWSFDDVQREVTIQFQYNWPAFFGFGFGQSMLKADIWVFEVVSGKIVVSDRVSSKETKPPLDTSLGGTEDVIILAAAWNQQGVTTVRVKRRYNTADPNDTILQPTASQNVILSFGPTATSYTLEYHQNKRGAYVFPFVNGAHSIAEPLEPYYQSA